MSGWRAEIPLVGPGGEPIDLWRTILSHGLNSLPPAEIDEEARVLTVTVPLSAGAATVRVREGDAATALVESKGGARGKKEALAQIAYLLRLDEDLSDFYELAAADPDLAWATSGAGRMMRSATIFEEVVKTICTTNCAWSGTERMVGALVEHLGEPAPDAPGNGPIGRTFPTPEAMAETDESFYRDVARAGYRGAYLRALATSVAEGSVDLDELDVANRDVSDHEVAKRLLALPGVGPYAAAHIMMLVGRYSLLVLDSWTRPKYARLTGRTVKDTTLVRRYRRYGRWAGLAFWLFLTRDWVEEGTISPPPEILTP